MIGEYFMWVIRTHKAKLIKFKNLSVESFSLARRAYLCSMQKIGILGGGQLGRMLLQAAANYPVETFVLENDPDCPAAHLCRHFTVGNIKDFDTVYNFGKGLDALTIEIEHVNVEALEKLEMEGVKIFPKTTVLRIIRNKILQKQFYTEHVKKFME